MIEKLKAMADEARAALAAAQTEDDVEAARVKFLGRKGQLRDLQQGIKDVPAEQRPEAGQLINQVKGELEAMLQQRQDELAAGSGPADAIDVTLPGRATRMAGRHPLMQVRQDMINIFLGLGYAVAEGPEVENYHYAFEELPLRVRGAQLPGRSPGDGRADDFLH